LRRRLRWLRWLRLLHLVGFLPHLLGSRFPSASTDAYEGVRPGFARPALVLLASEATPHHTVMAGLVPAIHVFRVGRAFKTWMPGTSPGMTSQRLVSRNGGPHGWR
jgi:hypothetical protein